MEALNNGHSGTSHFVLYGEVVLPSEVTKIRKGPQSVFLIETFSIVLFFFGSCTLYAVALTVDIRSEFAALWFISCSLVLIEYCKYF